MERNSETEVVESWKHAIGEHRETTSNVQGDLLKDVRFGPINRRWGV
jgi:hypothetical protein